MDMRLVFWVVSLSLFTAQVWAHGSYTGYSGAPTRQTCASSCHGSSGGTVTVSGFPTEYTPGQAYTITVGHSGGSTIANFNASCRVGSGSTNAGTITAGTGTSTYNVSGETNGVHLTSNNQNSGTFTWTAPAAGAGDVHLYLGGHQGTYGGQNTALNLTAAEATVSAPGEASEPNPSDNQEDVYITDSLMWTAGSDATSHDVYLGTVNPPDSVAHVTATTYVPPAPLLPGVTYYWQIVERNSAGTTPGPVWQFSTLPLPGQAFDPFPADGDSGIDVRATLSWYADGSVSEHDVYLGTTNPPPLVSQGQSGGSYTPPQNLTEGTLYYWRANVRNASGTTEGPLWTFRTEAANAATGRTAPIPTELALGPVYPNPFNATVTIPFALPQVSKVSLALYDVTGRLVAVMANGNYAAGVHSVQWSSSGVGSGVYLVRLQAGNKTMTTKVVALK
jgi:hypothetical protein